jgi:hypothetical protein
VTAAALFGGGGDFDTAGPHKKGGLCGFAFFAGTEENKEGRNKK